MTDTGGQAFPGYKKQIINKYGDFKEVPFEGMTLRDYFAGQAMIGILSGLSEKISVGINNVDNNDAIALVAGALADAMIKEMKS